MRSIVLFRRDLRIRDNVALLRAMESSSQVLLLYVHDEHSDQMGSAQKSYLHDTLAAFQNELFDELENAKIVLYSGSTSEILLKLVIDHKIQAVFWNRRYDPKSIAFDKSLKKSLEEQGVTVTSCEGHLLYEPWTIANKTGGPYQVFTPFWKTATQTEPHAEMLFAGQKPRDGFINLDSLELNELKLKPKLNWDEQFQKTFPPGSQVARMKLKDFLKNKAEHYDDDRNRPDRDGTSCLSPYLALGVISPRTIWWESQLAMSERREKKYHDGVKKFLSEIGWREFAYHLIYHFPHTVNQPLQKAFEKFPWEDRPEEFKSWCRGETGYPIIDAGMRQLWREGWMHNRVRMIVASYLVKDLRINWLDGERWFWDTLIDADPANNVLGWQWTAGCGADAAPYFRVFNPTGQSEKFDPNGDYIRKYVPELKPVPKKWIHDPSCLSPLEMQEFQCVLGRDYPHPRVNHAEERERALAAFSRFRDYER